MKRTKKCYDLMDLALKECNKRHCAGPAASPAVPSAPLTSSLPAPPFLVSSPSISAAMLRPSLCSLSLPRGASASLRVGETEDFWGLERAQLEREREREEREQPQTELFAAQDESKESCAADGLSLSVAVSVSVSAQVRVRVRRVRANASALSERLKTLSLSSVGEEPCEKERETIEAQPVMLLTM